MILIENLSVNCPAGSQLYSLHSRMKILKKLSRKELIDYITECDSRIKEVELTNHTFDQLLLEKLRIDMREEKVKRGRPRTK